MKNAPQISRRRLLQMLASAPLLPLASLGSAGMLTACGGGGSSSDIDSNSSDVTLSSVEFSSMPAPNLNNAAAMATTTTASIMTVTFSDGSKLDFDLAYEPFFITGQNVPDGNGGTVIAGGYYDINNNPIMDSTGTPARQFYSDAPDGTSLLTVANANVPGVIGKPVFAVVQFEYTNKAQDGTSMYGKLPSPIAVLTLDQDQITGKLSLVKYHNVDTSGVEGLWITCGASLSPWGTHLSSEEYPPNAFSPGTGFTAFSTNLYNDSNTANPYNYGHLPEVIVNPDGTATIKKHYCLGRISHELVQVMPDNRTVLMGDDTTNGGYFVFVADNEKDLSSGTLYAAKVGAGFSIDPSASVAPLTWIKLGSATSAEIKALAASTAATAIFDRATTNPNDATYTEIRYNGGQEWIRLKPGMEKAAAFLETHRYAALLGASMAFTKMEGTTVNIKDKVAYSALSACSKSMVAGQIANFAGAYGVSIPQALNAGAVMALNLAGGARDTNNAAINSEWMPVAIKALLTGEDLASADALGNTANLDKIANPDNLKFSEKMRTLFIGEDSGMHVNNFLWAYNVDTKTLSRIMSVPSGAESTGLHAVDEINGWTYIMSNFQHPGDWESIHAIVQGTLDPLINTNYANKFGAAVGYLTGDVKQFRLSKA